MVNVKLNGVYQGVDELVEHVRIAPELVNIPTLKITDTSEANVSGGYLLEVDERSGEAYWFKSTMTASSAVDYYLLQELLNNVDGNPRLSTFLYKPRGGKLTFGPVRDFDIAMGNVNYSQCDQIVGLYIRNAQ